MSDMKTHLVLFVIIIASLISCIREKIPEEIPIISFQEANATIDLRLVDFIQDIQLIPLETTENSLLGHLTHLRHGRNNIIIVTQNSILQYNNEGKFIRHLVQKGRGPDEFSNLVHLELDDENELLYYLQRSDNKIYRIDLRTGNQLKPIIPASNIIAATFCALKPNNIAIFPDIKQSSDFLLIYQDTLGDIKKSIHMPREGSVPNVYSIMHPKIIGSSILYFHSQITGDTLFYITGTESKPYFILNEKKDFSPEKEIADGFLSSPFPLTENIWLFNNAETIKNGYSYGVKVKYYLAKIDKQKLFEVNSFYNDIAGTYHRSSVMMLAFSDACSIDLDDRTICIAIEPGNLIKTINSEKLIDLPKEIQPIILRLKDSLSLDMNPVILIGKISGDKLNSRLLVQD